jgi:hypothetical protein
MPAGQNTKSGLGVMRMIRSLPTPQMRAFEDNGTQTYNVVVSFSGIYKYTYAGVVYAAGATIPYDAAGGTMYSNMGQLERDFNSGWLDPSN